MSKLPPEALPDYKRVPLAAIILRGQNDIRRARDAQGDLKAIREAAENIGRIAHVRLIADGPPVLGKSDEKIAAKLLKAALKGAGGKKAEQVADAVRDGFELGLFDPEPVFIAPMARREIELELHVESEMERQGIRREADRRLKAFERGDRVSIRDSLLDYQALMERPGLVPLVDGVIFERTLALLYGPPGIGKSFLSVAMACSVATSVDWLGRGVAQGRVLIVQAEGDAGMGKRLAAWSNAWYADKAIPNLDVYPRALDMSDTDGDVAELVELNAEAGYALIVLDTLNRVAGGAEENSSSAMSLVLGNIEKVRLAGERTTALIVHHSGKNGDMRGSNSLLGNPDTVLELKGDPGLLELKAMKQKDAPSGIVGHFKLSASPIHDSLVVEGVLPGQGQPQGVQAARIEEALAHFVRTFGEDGSTRAQFVDYLAEWMQVGKSTAQQYVGDLLSSGRLVSTRYGARGSRLALPPERATFSIETPTDNS